MDDDDNMTNGGDDMRQDNGTPMDDMGGEMPRDDLGGDDSQSDDMNGGSDDNGEVQEGVTEGLAGQDVDPAEVEPETQAELGEAMGGAETEESEENM